MARDGASGADVLALARVRLAGELRALEVLAPDLQRAALLPATGGPGVSRGALVHFIRHAVDSDQPVEAETLFVALLERIAGLTRQWARQTILSAGLSLPAEAWRAHTADLAQELTLRLWDAIACGDEPAWELFFGRALAFTQSHVADAWLRRVRPRLAGRALPPPVSLSGLSGDDGEPEASRIAAPLASAQLGAAELADLRALVARLPERERLAVVLRYWAGASEERIALALGGVSTRTVRNTLRRAYSRLRVWYAGGAPAPVDGPAGE